MGFFLINSISMRKRRVLKGVIDSHIPNSWEIKENLRIADILTKQLVTTAPFTQWWIQSIRHNVSILDVKTIIQIVACPCSKFDLNILVYIFYSIYYKFLQLTRTRFSSYIQSNILRKKKWVCLLLLLVVVF